MNFRGNFLYNQKQELQQFKVLRSRVLDISNGTLRKCLKPTNQMIENFFACELAYINTNHPDFIGTNLLSRTALDQETSSEMLKGKILFFFNLKIST